MGGHGWHIGTPLHRKEYLSLLPCFLCSADFRSLRLLINCYEYVRYVMRFFWAVAKRSKGSLNIIAHTHLAINIRKTMLKPFFGCPLLCWLPLSPGWVVGAVAGFCSRFSRSLWSVAPKREMPRFKGEPPPPPARVGKKNKKSPYRAGRRAGAGEHGRTPIPFFAGGLFLGLYDGENGRLFIVHQAIFFLSCA